MGLSFYYIANGKLHSYVDGKDTELRSGVLDSYLYKVRDSAGRNEWKYTGEGANFRGAYTPGADAESRVAAVTSRVFCAEKCGDNLIYSLAIDRTTGVYRVPKDGGAEGIVISSGDTAYYDFNIKNGRMTVTSAFAGESHIGVLTMGSTNCRVYTEGHTWDSRPVWSAIDDNKIYFCCAGLPIEDSDAERRSHQPDYSEMVTQMFTTSAPTTRRGPSSICLLDISNGTMDELLSDDKYDYTAPQSMPDGSLYYIRKPYASDNGGGSALGCLGETLMLPIRLLRALFGFLNVFSAKYSGKTLSKTVGAKNQDEAKLFIDGNLINAEAELRANRTRGEENPGIIPHSWELRRREANGEDTLIRRGVVAYRVIEESGDILISNGSAILKRTHDGKEEKMVSVSQVTFIR